MILVDNVEVFNFKGAIRGMRNPMNSWDKSDSVKCYANENCYGICKNNKCGWHIGRNDLDLMRRLYKAGTEHRKYLRQISVSMDITAPLYWWKEFDTYKVGTVANSCSTMHKIHAKEFELDDFSCEHLKDCDSAGLTEFYDFPCGRQYTPMDSLADTIKMLNFWRSIFLTDKNKSAWWQMIQLLPSSYNQRRTVTMNYENVMTIIKQRSGHKLDEWNQFVETLKDLPYITEIMEN